MKRIWCIYFFVFLGCLFLVNDVNGVAEPIALQLDPAHSLSYPLGVRSVFAPLASFQANTGPSISIDKIEVGIQGGEISDFITFSQVRIKTDKDKTWLILGEFIGDKMVYKGELAMPFPHPLVSQNGKVGLECLGHFSFSALPTRFSLEFYLEGTIIATNSKFKVGPVEGPEIRLVDSVVDIAPVEVKLDTNKATFLYDITTTTPLSLGGLSFSLHLKQPSKKRTVHFGAKFERENTFSKGGQTEVGGDVAGFSWTFAEGEFENARAIVSLKPGEKIRVFSFFGSRDFFSGEEIESALITVLLDTGGGFFYTIPHTPNLQKLKFGEGKPVAIFPLGKQLTTWGGKKVK